MAEAGAAPHGWPADGCCANCSTVLAGPWCYACGQRAVDHHRSIRHLCYEAIESLTHVDGRLWRTLRLLALHPGRLTREYLAGHRAREIPPLRLFLITLVLVFSVSTLSGGNHKPFANLKADAPHIHHAMNGINIQGFPALTHWLRVHAALAVDNPDAVARTMRDWAERFAFLLLPLSALSLKLLFPLRRDVGLYDHLIFTMHSLSFAGMVVALDGLLSGLPVLGDFASLLIFTLPVHLFVHMRGTYHTSIFGTLARMALLGTMTGVIFLILLIGLALLALDLISS